MRGARAKYVKDLNAKSNCDLESKKRKHNEKINVITAKIERLNDESSYLVQLADKKGVEAEKKASLKYMAESNALRTAAKTKKEEAVNAAKELEFLKSTKF